MYTLGGSPTCTQCPVGTTSTPAGILCNDCMPGSYSDQQVMRTFLTVFSWQSHHLFPSSCFQSYHTCNRMLQIDCPYNRIDVLAYNVLCKFTHHKYTNHACTFSKRFSTARTSVTLNISDFEFIPCTLIMPCDWLFNDSGVSTVLQCLVCFWIISNIAGPWPLQSLLSWLLSESSRG